MLRKEWRPIWGNKPGTGNSTWHVLGNKSETGSSTRKIWGNNSGNKPKGGS